MGGQYHPALVGHRQIRRARCGQHYPFGSRRRRSPNHRGVVALPLWVEGQHGRGLLSSSPSQQHRSARLI